MNFFFDRNLGKRLAWMLDAYDPDHTVRHLDDDARFSRDDSDIRLVEVLSREQPPTVLVTADVSMRRKPEERRALAGSGLTVVFLRGSFNNLSFHEQAVKLLRRWPEITRECLRAKVPTAFEITAKASKVQRLWPTSELSR